MNVPRLRFKEFNDEIKIFSFNDVADYKKGPFGSSLKKEMFVPKSDKSIKIYEQQNAIKKDWKLSRYFVTKNYADKLKGFEVGPNDIIVSCAGTIGESYILPNDAENGIINQALMRIRVKNIINQKYFLYVFDNMITNFSKTFSNGSAIKNIPPFADLKKQILYLPSLEEQNKISKFISLLDKKIELQSKKIEALKLYKSSLIRCFFENTKYEKCKLKDIGQFISSNSIGKEKITNIGVPLILYGDLYTKYDETIQDIKQFCEDNEKYVKSELNDLIFPTSTTVDAISLISPSSIKINGAVYGGDIIIFKPTVKKINSDFLSFEINNYLKKYFSTFAQGSTIIHIQADNLLNCNILLPNSEIQSKFANCFNLYNKKVKLEKEKLTKLKSLKKGLMQNIFI